MLNTLASLSKRKVLRRLSVGRITVVVLLCWTVLIAASVGWNVHNENRAVILRAISEARGMFDKDLAYRRWNAAHGGVYVRVDEETPPNPYLKLPERDISTPSGRRLTLSNSAYMTRQVIEQSKRQYGVSGHITSLKLLRPANAPDEWERKALSTFAQGQIERSEVISVAGKPYLRFMHSMKTTAHCLPCHQGSGYKVGDSRGGISFSIPLQGYYQLRHADIIALILWHGLIYLFGCGIIGGSGYILLLWRRDTEKNEQESSTNQQRILALLELAQLSEVSEKELLDIALAKAISLSSSSIGYVHYFDEEAQTVTLGTWDKSTLDTCQVVTEKHTFLLSQKSRWGESLRQRQAVIHNEYPACVDTGTTALPSGHVTLQQHMSTPIFYGEQIVGIIGVGNKEQPYNDSDAAQLELYAKGLWQIIQRRRAEEQLHRFKALVDQSSDAIFIIDIHSGNVIDVNQQLCTALGYTRQALLAMQVEQIDGAPQQNFSWSQQLLMIAQDKRLVVEGQYKRKDTSCFPVEISARSVTLDGISYAVISARDISERQAAQRELAEHRQHLETLVLERTIELECANERLQELDGLKSMFIASMSHELRTPLNAIIGFSSLMLNGVTGDINAEQHDQLQRVLRAGKHLLSLITDVIDISKIESNKIQLYASEFNLSEVIDEACGTLEPQLAAKQIQLIRHLETESIALCTDRKRLLQCILNYLSNAVKFTVQGQVEITLNIEDNELTICVADSGPGISTEDLTRLFQSFVRLASSLSNTTGTGLGLYLTKKLAEEVLGGTVWAESIVGEGSRFYLKIPLRLCHPMQ